MRRVARALVLSVALVVAACAHTPALPSRQQTGDAVRDLRVAADRAEAALPLARLTCAALRVESERALCGKIVARIEAAVPKARAMLARADECAGQDDEAECIHLAVDGANVILRALQGGEEPATAASSASPPAASSAAPAASAP